MTLNPKTGLNAADFVLVDATKADICIDPATRLSQLPLCGGYEDIEGALSYTDWKTNHDGIVPQKKPPRSQFRNEESLIQTLVRHFAKPPPHFNAANPNLLSIAYYPTRIALWEWKLYTLLLSRYVKHYEYSRISYSLRLQQSSLEELQPWRRRCVQSRLKLAHFQQVISRHKCMLVDETEKELWGLLLLDVEHLTSQIGQWAAFLDSMVNLLDTHQSLIEARDVKRLTYVVIAFVPLSLFAGIFSRNAQSL